MNASKFLFVAVLISLAACSSPKPDKVTTGTNDVTVLNGNQGAVTIGSSADPSKLGAPVYPGATANQNGSMAVSGQSGSAAMASFKTTDDFDKVYQYYKGQMPAGSEKMKMSSGDTSSAMFVVADDKNPKAPTTSVQISGKAGETDIVITHQDGQQ